MTRCRNCPTSGPEPYSLKYLRTYIFSIQCDHDAFISPLCRAGVRLPSDASLSLVKFQEGKQRLILASSQETAFEQVRLLKPNGRSRCELQLSRRHGWHIRGVDVAS